MLHSFNLQHGVDVFEAPPKGRIGVSFWSHPLLRLLLLLPVQGERYSVIFWFKDSEASVKDGSTPWYDTMAAESSDTSATWPAILRVGR